MKVVVIEEKVFDDLLSSIEMFVHKFEQTLNSESEKRLGRWLDTHEVCALLNLSKRTVQSLRASGKLPSTQICKKNYYKPEDIEKLLKERNDES